MRAIDSVNMEELENIIQQLSTIEGECRHLEVSAIERSHLLEETQSFAENFLQNLPQLEAYSDDGYERTEEDDFFNIDGAKSNLNKILPFIKSRVNHAGFNSASGGYMGYIPGGGIYESALGDYMAAVTNVYAGIFHASPGAVRMENALIRWAANLVGYESNSGGNLTSGGSLANLIAISAARTTHGIKGKDLERAVIYTTRHTHHSNQKAIKICGMEECPIHYIELDINYRLDATHLEIMVKEDIESGLRPFLVVGNAGSTNQGAVDPLDEISRIALENNMWFHIDGAYGGFFLITEYGKRKLAGIEKADSVVLDPHKGLFLPYGTGMVLVKDVRHLLAANSFEAHYMQDAREHQEEYSPAELSPELSRHFRGLRMWLPLKLHGLEPFRKNLNEKILLARYFYWKIKELGFDTGPFPDLSIVGFRYIPAHSSLDDINQWNMNLVKHIHHDGRVFISSTFIKDIFVIRCAILSFRTHRHHVDLLLKVIGEYTNAHN